ncbi:M48 family metallopeptidase [Candidatus Stoquefichus sp. SB1]|uniref:M48 family metallopeptidase n=1 Tax=Candidatus Stoquefichus sp. SB1 TaxID=1658109 RepID=UPI00067E8827|nr:YgjP-like metallopeptidase domain-containing protein [Candidatus Stoquefichus sp. SB1]
MKSYEIQLGQEVYHYDVIYKRMTSLRMRVKEGRIVVSAPYYTPRALIEDNLRQYQEKLIPLIQNYESYACYCDQGYVDIFACRYVLVSRDVGKWQCEKHGQSLYVYHRQIEQCVEKYLKQVLLDYIEEKVIAYLAYDFDLDMPHIEIKKYKGRWGSCYYQQNRISFNLSLVHLEKDLIDYVIVHELTHFLQANHSSQFYQEIEKRMPDYKQRIKRLKEKHV